MLPYVFCGGSYKSKSWFLWNMDLLFLHLLPDVISDPNYNSIIAEFLFSIKDILHEISLKNEKMAFYIDVKCSDYWNV